MVKRKDDVIKYKSGLTQANKEKQAYISFINLSLNNFISLWLSTKYKYRIKSPKFVAFDRRSLEFITTSIY